MIDLGLIVGHFLGDYIFQNDWQAKNKTVFGVYLPEMWRDAKSWRDGDGVEWPNGTTTFHNAMVEDHEKQQIATQLGHLACTVHCIIYTLAVWLCSFWWMPWWGLVACFACHWPVDRFRLASRWMRNVAGQDIFASPYPIGMAPWSIVVVDNTFHLLTLFIIEAIAFA
jgi:hypothetical protein